MSGRPTEQGFSLVETLVAATIFGVFSSMVMLAITAMLNSTAKTQSVQDGSIGVADAFQRLDHQVRYADAVNKVGQVGANWYVEWHDLATASAPETCYQLKYNAAAKTLQERSWAPKAAVVSASPWVVVVSNLVNDTTVAGQLPFVRTLPDGTTTQKEQLTVNVLSRPNGGTTAKSAISTANTTFTALNSTMSTSFPTGSAPCQEVGRT
jgi:prepilin-type N-terminal cleavage/methylation domain-containing protein